MFAVSPRLSDDFGLWQLTDDLSRPVFDPRDWSALRNAASLAGESEVHNTDKELRIRCPLRHFRPEEVKITSDNQRIIVTARHEEKEDKHGYVMREIVRTFPLPEDVDPKSVTSTLNSQGTLNIRAAKRALEAPKETAIPVEFKG